MNGRVQKTRLNLGQGHESFTGTAFRCDGVEAECRAGSGAKKTSAHDRRACRPSSGSASQQTGTMTQGVQLPLKVV